ncbi:hypothetical protein FRACYDRAFT_236856 [Fragilariopsis cylindrus CCMP1102]|uniref:Uncharacterized protein n=1 Tax=Fragilariopsis cylindrus CCMP1102 TaxID=635003 RepID=A0A1E7FK70_9STRA|nr:hypothetical protein FRACYDRAFT_236856 [Fragilariopsis cylindrus CCMP1102]|eukprot:OEU18579.1 hypothetical protein FRACYDRAFT_236856 [Fragilariopsis cylindrus CCMP1102]
MILANQVLIRVPSSSSQQRRIVRIPSFVNLSGRFFIPSTYDPSKRFTPDQVKELNANGRLKIGRRGSRNLYISREDMEERNRLDSSLVQRIRSSRVLVMHSDADNMVPIKNAYLFEKTLASRSNPTKALELVAEGELVQKKSKVVSYFKFVRSKVLITQSE